MHHSVDLRCRDREVREFGGMYSSRVWKHGYIVAQTPDPIDLGTINLGMRGGGPRVTIPHVHASR